MGLLGAVWVLEAFGLAPGAVGHELFHLLELSCFANGASYM